MFEHAPEKAKEAANESPVFIKDRGRPTHALVSYEEFEAKWKRPISALAALEDRRATIDKDIDPPQLRFRNRDIEFRRVFLFDTNVASASRPSGKAGSVIRSGDDGH
ncbi:MAG: hypothetical protein PW791_03815 [Neorhizobium sp.]|nr:hypothetical protein [Neorhizobium sp.]